MFEQGSDRPKIPTEEQIKKDLRVGEHFAILTAGSTRIYRREQDGNFTRLTIEKGSTTYKACQLPKGGAYVGKVDL